jgi:hypothetical protein
MLQIHRTNILLGTLLAISFVPVGIAGDGAVATSVSGAGSIFLAEIQNAEPGPGCEPQVAWGRICRTRVRARAILILKEDGPQDSVPCEFEVEIQQDVGSHSVTGPWTGRSLQPGLQYLIFFNSKKSLPEMFASPSSTMQTTAEEDTVADVELILRSQLLSVRQQAAAAAQAIVRSGVPHSSFLSEYLATLLRVGNDADTVDLFQAIENSTDLALSANAMSGLLFQLGLQLRSADTIPDNLLHTFVTMTARYFATEPDKPSPALPDIRGTILTNYIPWILGSERVTTIFRKALPPASVQQFRQKALEVVIDRRYSINQKEHLRQLLAAINQN